jgi:hypothetical protein
MHFERQSDGSYNIDQALYLQRKLEEYADEIGPGQQSTPIRPNFLYDLEKAEASNAVDPTFPYRKILSGQPNVRCNRDSIRYFYSCINCLALSICSKKRAL